MRLYVITTETHHKWLVRSGSEAAALAQWKKYADAGAAEEAVSARRPESRREIAYLRLMGQADA